MHILFLFLPLVFCTNDTYFGIRVAKSLGAMLRDNIFVAENASKNIAGTRINDIIISHEDWWIRPELHLTKIKVINFIFDQKKLTLKSRLIGDNCVLEAFVEGPGLDWLINFDWRIQIYFFHIKGTVELKVASKEFSFKQEYKNSNIKSDIKVEWKPANIVYKGINIRLIKNWVENVTETVLIPKLTPLINDAFNLASKELIRPYGNITIDNKVGAVNIENNLLSASKGSYNEREYVVMSFGAEISAVNKEYRQKVYSSLSTTFGNSSKKFDYEICVNSNLFGECFDFLIKAGYPVFKGINTSEHHSYIGFYKRILHYLGNIYPDHIKVSITPKELPYKSLGYITPNIFLIPIEFDFAVVKNESKELIFTLNVIFKFHNQVNETEDKHITATLAKGVVDQVEMVPEVNYQSRFAAVELTESLSVLLKNYTIATLDGLSIGTVRSKNYSLHDIDIRYEEACFLYIDQEI